MINNFEKNNSATQADLDMLEKRKVEENKSRVENENRIKDLEFEVKAIEEQMSRIQKDGVEGDVVELKEKLRKIKQEILDLEKKF